MSQGGGPSSVRDLYHRGGGSGTSQPSRQGGFSPSSSGPSGGIEASQFLNIDLILRAYGVEPALIDPEKKAALNRQWLRITPDMQQKAIARLREEGENLLRNGTSAQKIDLLTRVLDPLLWSRRNPITRQLSTVQKNVYRTIDQEKRDRLAQYGARTVRGHGGPNELPVLAYVSSSGRVNYLNKAQRLACLQGILPNAPTCPNPPTWADLPAALQRINVRPR